MTKQTRNKTRAVGLIAIALAELDGVLCIFSGLSHSALHESRAIWQGASAGVLLMVGVARLVRARQS